MDAARLKAPQPPRMGSILLFYQYKEPVWSKSEHKIFLKHFITLATQHNIQGRGRVAPEGVNCTLSCQDPDSMRTFCQVLRNNNVLFQQTDFKITNNVPRHQLFRSLSVRKTTELVAYGMASQEKAPSLTKFAGKHLEANDYHQALKDKNAVVIDVRNAYETAIGTFQPDGDGAQLIDPQMRNSIEFSKWLADPSTLKSLHGKKILTFCTGGIRCERATALINQMSVANPSSFKPQGVYELKGGIERYLKTHPDGGFWKGKNYLFDRRMEQIPANKTAEQVEAEVNTSCCLCRQKCTVYRGKRKCSRGLCGVPVIVCQTCQAKASSEPSNLVCELCRQGYKTPQMAPDLVGLKRKAELVLADDKEDGQETLKKTKQTAEVTARNDFQVCTDRLFISRLPRILNKTKLIDWLGETVMFVHWLTDQQSGAFYGSCIVQMDTSQSASRLVVLQPKLDKKKPKISFAKINKSGGEQWPPTGYTETELPPFGNR